jgi:hypothetical protein
MHKRIPSLIYFFRIILHASNNLIYNQPLTKNVLLFIVFYKIENSKKLAKKRSNLIIILQFYLMKNRVLLFPMLLKRLLKNYNLLIL